MSLKDPNFMQPHTADGLSVDEDPPPGLSCIGRTSRTGPSAAETVLRLIGEVQRPLLCVQCLWVNEPLGFGIELTAFFEGDGHYSAILLGGIHGNGERRVLGGSIPPFLAVAAAKAVGAHLKQQYSAEFYFPWYGFPDDRMESWLDFKGRKNS